MNDALPWNEDPLANGWKEHSQFHWSRVVNGKRLDYWPTKNKFQYDGVVQTGEVYKFIRSLEAGTTPVVEQEQPRVIDLTPTWGEIGRLFCNLAKSNEQEALRHILPEAARAFALAEGMKAVYDDLPLGLKDKVSKIVSVELNKQGY